jgi:hypothetical protein
MAVSTLKILELLKGKYNEGMKIEFICDFCKLKKSENNWRHTSACTLPLRFKTKQELPSRNLAGDKGVQL